MGRGGDRIIDYIRKGGSLDFHKTYVQDHKGLELMNEKNAN